MTTFVKRLKDLISSRTVAFRRNKEMEALTGISTATWRNWWHRESVPTGEMIEAVCRVWPECAFWLTTGISDEGRGHVQPALNREVEQCTSARSGFLEGDDGVSDNSPAARVIRIASDLVNALDVAVAQLEAPTIQPGMRYQMIVRFEALLGNEN